MTQDIYNNEKRIAITAIQNIISDSLYRDNFEHAIDMLVSQCNQKLMNQQLVILRKNIKDGILAIEDSRKNSYRDIITALNNIVSQLHAKNKLEGNIITLNSFQ